MTDPVFASSQWGSPIQAWEYVSNQATIDFLNLAPYYEVMVWFAGLTNNSGTTAQLYMRTSTNNGGAFTGGAGNYDSAGGSATNLLTVGPSVAAATPSLGQVFVYDMKSSSYRTKVQALVGAVGSSNPSPKLGERTTAESNNAIRFGWSDGSEFTGGRALLYVRRG